MNTYTPGDVGCHPFLLYMKRCDSGQDAQERARGFLHLETHEYSGGECFHIGAFGTQQLDFIIFVKPLQNTRELIQLGAMPFVTTIANIHLYRKYRWSRLGLLFKNIGTWHIT